LQIPTTLLAMIDSSVGGKTGVNSDFGKNLIGAFHQPNGVLIDVETLKTLPHRELVAGFCEAIKHGAIASRELFSLTSGFLQNYPLKNFRKFSDDVQFLSKFENLLAAQVAFKAEIVMNDEREAAGRTDAKSRKILNFGHTLGHALEKVTDYKYFKHGEAVGYGILFASELSKKLEILDANELKLLNDVFQNIGSLPETKNIQIEKVVQAFSFDKKNIGRSLQWILLKGIGEPVILSNTEIPEKSLQKTLKKILQKSSSS
jgi:3-dehydroquinate synthase